MRVLRAEVIPLPLQLREPYTIAYETLGEAHNLLLRLVTDGPHVGLGVAAPDEGVTGETAAGCERALREVAEPLLTGAQASRRLALLEPLRETLPGNPAARAAVDMALADLLAKRAALPAWELLGGYRPSIPTSVTLFIEEREAMLHRARALLEAGFTALKLKGGLDVDADIDRVLALRSLSGPGIELRFDANQGYDVEQATRFVERTRSAGLSMIEQPTPADKLAQMRAVVGAVPERVMADESVLSLADAFRFARRDAMDMLNLKLNKVGGLDAAGLINGVARAAGVEVMVGCVDECALSISAGLAFALSRPQVERADLDGHLDLIDDPTAGCVHLERGVLYPSPEPGFGLQDLG